MRIIITRHMNTRLVGMTARANADSNGNVEWTNYISGCSEYLQPHQYQEV